MCCGIGFCVVGLSFVLWDWVLCCGIEFCVMMCYKCCVLHLWASVEIDQKVLLIALMH